MEVIQKSTAKYSTTDRQMFIGVDCNCDKLDSGVYRTYITYQGEHQFTKLDKSKSEMLEFPSEQQNAVTREIHDFWGKRDEYKKLGLTFKRGVLLYGPQGSGKTSVLNILIKDLIERDGVIIDFRNAKYDIPCIQFLRKAEPERPLMVVMEDLDALLSDKGENNESNILNLLDGILQIENVVFLATTNYPEQLQERITDRPSRFDRVVQVGLPQENDRRFYLSHLLGKMDTKKKGIDIDKWVKDTQNLSVAHLKELVISVMLYNKDYRESLSKLDGMKRPLSAKGRKGEIGMGRE